MMISNVDLCPYTNDQLKELTTEQLANDLSKFTALLEEAKMYKDTNANMVDKYIDMPGMEHLIDMSINSSPKDGEIGALKFKVRQLDEEIIRRSSDECNQCKV